MSIGSVRPLEGPRKVSRPPVGTGICAFPLIRENPYQEVLYGELAAHGFELVEDADFKLGWLWQARRSVGVLHFHWPQNYYRWWRPPMLLRPALSWMKVVLFGVRLVAARAFGFTIVWTVHEVYPHERAGRGLDRVGSRLLARAARVLIAHDHGTATRAADELGVASNDVEVIPHGSYIGVYPEGRARATVRAELGIGDSAFTFLCFGHIRAYKAVEVLLESFGTAVLPPGATLVIAGVPPDDRTADAVRQEALRNDRIKPLLEFIPDERVAELFAASDAAVLPRGDGGTSGSLVLALSLGLPTVAADRPDYVELVGDAGWWFEAGSSASLACALAEAASDPEEVSRRSGEARNRARALAWPEIAARTASLLSAARAGRPARLTA